MTANVDRTGMKATCSPDEWAPVEPGVCLVLHCTDQSRPLHWLTEDALGGWPTSWAVCAYHYWRLDGGKACVRVNEGEPASHRWLLMDEDLETEGPGRQEEPQSTSA